MSFAKCQLTIQKQAGKSIDYYYPNQLFKINIFKLKCQLSVKLQDRKTIALIQVLAVRQSLDNAISLHDKSLSIHQIQLQLQLRQQRTVFEREAQTKVINRVSTSQIMAAIHGCLVVRS